MHGITRSFNREKVLRPLAGLKLNTCRRSTSKRSWACWYVTITLFMSTLCVSVMSLLFCSHQEPVERRAWTKLRSANSKRPNESEIPLGLCVWHSSTIFTHNFVAKQWHFGSGIHIITCTPTYFHGIFFFAKSYLLYWYNYSHMLNFFLFRYYSYFIGTCCHRRRDDLIGDFCDGDACKYHPLFSRNPMVQGTDAV